MSHTDDLVKEISDLKDALAEISRLARESREMVCGYYNGETRCDCKFLNGPSHGEKTGCCEFRTIWGIAKDALK